MVIILKEGVYDLFEEMSRIGAGFPGYAGQMPTIWGLMLPAMLSTLWSSSLEQCRGYIVLSLFGKLARFQPHVLLLSLCGKTVQCC